MYPNWWVSIGFGIIVIWLGGVTYLLWSLRQFLQKLFPDGEGSFRNRLDEVLQQIRFVKEFEERCKKNLQKVALKRFNPYNDTGGDQSFTVSLLDGNGDGLVVTSLHARSGTRVFAKPIKNGKESGVELSEEEKEVVKEAIK